MQQEMGVKKLFGISMTETIWTTGTIFAAGFAATSLPVAPAINLRS